MKKKIKYACICSELNGIKTSLVISCNNNYNNFRFTIDKNLDKHLYNIVQDFYYKIADDTYHQQNEKYEFVHIPQDG